MVWYVTFTSKIDAGKVYKHRIMIVRKTIKGDMAEYNRDIIELKTNAALWWSEKLINKNALGLFF